AAQAKPVFEAVIATNPGEDPQLISLRNSALLGRGACLAAGGQFAEAVQAVESVIDEAPETAELYAKAYNTLGYCHAKGNKTKDAVLAYLRVETLYSTQPQEHAKALFHLIALWRELGKDDYAKQCQDTLVSRYKNSSWAKKLAP
ncbi:MAG: tetratricopeptide repeat protein, partial [Planctomycetales bacterium]